MLADGRRADAASMTGKRASEASASTSVNAFELRRVSSDDLSRVTDAASSQALVDAPAPEERRESAFPASEQEAGGRYACVRPSKPSGPEGPRATITTRIRRSAAYSLTGSKLDAAENRAGRDRRPVRDPLAAEPRVRAPRYLRNVRRPPRTPRQPPPTRLKACPRSVAEWVGQGEVGVYSA